MTGRFYQQQTLSCGWGPVVGWGHHPALLRRLRQGQQQAAGQRIFTIAATPLATPNGKEEQLKSNHQTTQTMWFLGWFQSFTSNHQLLHKTWCYNHHSHVSGRWLKESIFAQQEQCQPPTQNKKWACWTANLPGLKDVHTAEFVGAAKACRSKKTNQNMGV